MLLAAAIFGAGFGLYLGVDMRLVVRVLPSDEGRGKDLGIMYGAIYVPLILSPVIGGGVLWFSPGNFALLFLLAAGASVLSALLIVPIRSVA